MCSFTKAIHVSLAITFLISVSLTNIVHGFDAKAVIDSPLLTQKIGTNRTIKVDLNGNGEFKSVQAAIDSVPEGNSQWIIIHLRKGVFREKVHIPPNKPYIFLRGNGRGRTHIVWSQSSSDNVESATFKVESPHFIAFGISFKNEAPTGVAYTSQNQSVAAFVAADKVAFYHSHNRENPTDNSGFVFVKGKVYGTDDVYLGRAKGPYSRTIFAKTYLSRTIVPQEFKTHGPGADTEYRAPWSKQLTEEEVGPFMSIDFIDGTEWLPVWL
ncbi:hypothetical protein G4B88_018146 [Cannabis sativa]|uniref:pectinesterase n=1 Tax=Cannabis sativa TaxID=3483 RepID=A0A7J6EKD9_CANSA|nr:hypothetical protein G4B88_018146 [Cannabis sativa]